MLNNFRKKLTSVPQKLNQLNHMLQKHPIEMDNMQHQMAIIFLKHQNVKDTIQKTQVSLVLAPVGNYMPDATERKPVYISTVGDPK